MSENWLIFLLLAFAAAFMPWQFAYEIVLFGAEKGPRKAGVFAGGLTTFRVLLIFVLGLLFAGITAYVTQSIVDVARFAQRLLVVLGYELSSGHRVWIDLLLVLSGVLLMAEAYFYYRGFRKNVSVEEVAAPAEGSDRSYLSLFLLGFGWMFISLKQWLFTLTGINQVLRITNDALGRVLLSLLFLLIASSLILIPFAIYLFKPGDTMAILERLNTLIQSTLGYVFTALMILGGLALIWVGGRGLLNYATGPGG